MQIIFLALLFLTSCVTTPPPLSEYALARSAIEAAKRSDAPVLSPGWWGKAEFSFKNAEVLFKNREFEEARAEFIRARKAAEKAENSSRVIRNRTGEIN